MPVDNGVSHNPMNIPHRAAAGDRFQRTLGQLNDCAYSLLIFCVERIGEKSLYKSESNRLLPYRRGWDGFFQCE